MFRAAYVGPTQAAAILGFATAATAKEYLDRIEFPCRRTPGGWRKYDLDGLLALRASLDKKDWSWNLPERP